MKGMAMQKSSDMNRATSTLLAVTSLSPKKPVGSCMYPKHTSEKCCAEESIWPNQHVFIIFPSLLYTDKSVLDWAKVIKKPITCITIDKM